MMPETYRRCRKCGLEWYETQVSFECPHCGRRLQDTTTILLRQMEKPQKQQMQEEDGGGDG